MVGTAATALPVSWHAGAQTLSPKLSPRTFPGSTTSGKMSTGIFTASRISSSHCILFGLNIWVVVAWVNSALFSPVNQKLKRSGSPRYVAALLSSRLLVFTKLASWYRVLSSRNWTPVLSKISLRGILSKTHSINPLVRVSL